MDETKEECYEIYKIISGFDIICNDIIIGEMIHFHYIDIVVFICLSEGKYTIYNSWADFMNRYVNNKYNIKIELL
jgi:hypothetical protein